MFLTTSLSALLLASPTAFPAKLTAESLVGKTRAQVEKLLGPGHEPEEGKEGVIEIFWVFKRGTVRHLLFVGSDVRPFDDPMYGKGPLTDLKFEFATSTTFSQATKAVGLKGSLRLTPDGTIGDLPKQRVEGITGSLSKRDVHWVPSRESPMITIYQRRD